MFTIRLTNNNDIATIKRFDGLLDNDMQSYLPDYFKGGGYTRDYSMLKNGSKSFALIASEDNSDVGFALVTCGNVAMLNSLFVLDASRGRGIGAALIRFAREEAKARGYNMMMVNVLYANDSARRLYEREGFLPMQMGLYREI